jgi:catechol 2,3-dioxygenase-like lactoylglutathione lyase family enzyme
VTTLAFSFTKLVVADLDASERFYREALGLRPLHRTRLPDVPIPQEQCALSTPGEGGHILLLARYLDRPPPAPGEAWTGFLVTDLKSAVEAVGAAGGRIVVPIHEAPAQGVRAAIVADPEGHLIELVQIPPQAAGNRG